MRHTVAWSLFSALFFLGCKAPEVLSGGSTRVVAPSHGSKLVNPLPSAGQTEWTLVEKELVALFALADRVVTGVLVVEPMDNRSGATPMIQWVKIGDRQVQIGDGWAVSEEDARRLLAMNGQVVTAGLNDSRGFIHKSVLSDGRHLCIGREDEVRNLQVARERLEAEPRWHPDSLVRETGDWARFLLRLPTQEGAWIDEELRPLRDVDYARAADILGWFARTLDQELSPLPSLRLHDGWGAWEFDDSRRLACFSMESALGLRAGSIVYQEWGYRECCRRMWLLWKLVGIAKGKSPSAHR